MNALTSLLREHQRIIHLVDALEAFVEQIEGNHGGSKEDVKAFASAFRDWVDLVHHEKEEAIVLPFAVRNGFDWESGSTADVRREHRQERYLIEVLDQASEQLEQWSDETRRQVAATARAIIDFERQHLAKENLEFFPALLAEAPPDALQQLSRELDRFDSERRQEAGALALDNSISELIRRFGPARTNNAAPSVSAAG